MCRSINCWVGQAGGAPDAAALPAALRARLLLARIAEEAAAALAAERARRRSALDAAQAAAQARPVPN